MGQMIIGKLYSIPFTKFLIAAVDKNDARGVTNKPLSYVSDLHAKDLNIMNGTAKLSKPYMGIKTVTCTKGVCDAWEHSR